MCICLVYIVYYGARRTKKKFTVTTFRITAYFFPLKSLLSLSRKTGTILPQQCCSQSATSCAWDTQRSVLKQGLTAVDFSPHKIQLLKWLKETNMPNVWLRYDAVCTVHHPTICIWNNKMHKILVIRLRFLLDALHVSNCISPSSGATL